MTDHLRMKWSRLQRCYITWPISKKLNGYI